MEDEVFERYYKKLKELYAIILHGYAKEDEIKEYVRQILEEAFTAGRAEYATFIPSNELGIREGYYSTNVFVALLRENKSDPERIQFLADMLEK